MKRFISGLILVAIVASTLLTAFYYRNNQAWLTPHDCMSAWSQIESGVLRMVGDLLEPVNSNYFLTNDYSKASGALPKTMNGKLKLHTKCGPLSDFKSNIEWSKGHGGLNPINPRARVEVARRESEKALRESVVRFIGFPTLIVVGSALWLIIIVAVVYMHRRPVLIE